MHTTFANILLLAYLTCSFDCVHHAGMHTEIFQGVGLQVLSKRKLTDYALQYGLHVHV